MKNLSNYALNNSLDLLKKAADMGFEWKNSEDSFKKVEEEIIEFKQAKNSSEKEEEFGDLLIALINYARMEGINPEEALHCANNKFQKRYEGMLNQARKSGQNFKDLSLDEMLVLWRSQK